MTPFATAIDPTWAKPLVKRFPLVWVLLLCLIPLKGHAQTNFTPLEVGDYMEKQERLAFSPGLQFSGNYNMLVKQALSGETPDRDDDELKADELTMEHDIALHLKTTFHRHISINLELAARQGHFNRSDLRQDGINGREIPNETQEADIQARQAYLEFLPHPNGLVRFGKQYLNLGDRNGKVYSGLMSGISQRCRAGTWCYELGGTKAGDHPADWLYFFALNYPVLESRNQAGNVTNRLDVEIFRIFYTERDVPLGNHLGPIARDPGLEDDAAEILSYSDETLTSDEITAIQRGRLGNLSQVVDQNGNGMFYDAEQQEYFGVRLNWVTSWIRLHFDITSNQGKRLYHLDRSLNLEPELGSNSGEFKNNHIKRSIAGVASELDLDVPYEGFTFGLRWMYASGTKEKQDSDLEGNNYIRTLNSYYEIVPGSYRGTNLYFGGSPEFGAISGLGHSVSNTQLIGFKFRYDATETPISYRGGLFSLSRVESVLDHDGEKTQDIGLELDNEIHFVMDKQLHLIGELNILKMGAAFTWSNGEPPVEDLDNVVHLAFKVEYFFDSK